MQECLVEVKQDALVGKYFRQLDLPTNAILVYKLFNDGLRSMLKDWKEYKRLCTLDGIENSFCKIAEFGREIIGLFCKMEERIRQKFADEWKKELFCPYGTVWAKQFLVSFTDSAAHALWTNYDVISCSLINTKLTKTYQDRKFGYLFYPESTQIVGMFSSDSGIACGQIRTKEEWYARAIVGDRYVGQDKYLQGVLTGFCVCYPINLLVDRTEEYNEVLLRGVTQPRAVFVFADAFEQYKNDVFLLSAAKNLPVVIWDSTAGSVRVLGTDMTAITAKGVKELFTGW